MQIYFESITRYALFLTRKMTYEGKVRRIINRKNKSLRSKIIQLYNETYPLNTNALDLKKYIHVNSIPFFDKIFLTLTNAELKVPIDFDALISDDEFTNRLSYIATEGTNFLNLHKVMLNKTKLIQDQIIKEIEKLN